MARAASIGNTVHKRQLFHWIGAHLENDRSLGKKEKRRRYLECLKGSLDRGLWLTRSPQELDADHAGEKPLHVQPMVCFTDNRLSECAYHAANYGKLGLGFPKRFVIDRFGGPVNYVSHKKVRNLYFKYIYDVARYLETTNVDGSNDAMIDKLGYVMSFLKPISNRRLPTKRPAKPSSPKPVDKPTPKPPPAATARRYGPQLRYLVENEWRIVADAVVIKKLKIQPHPDFESVHLLPYEAKKDLFSIVLPDRPTLQAALEDDELRERLYEARQTNLYVLDEVSEL